MSAEGEVLDEVTPELVRRIEDALDGAMSEAARALLSKLSAVGLAAVLEQVTGCFTGFGEGPDRVGKNVVAIIGLGLGEKKSHGNA